jgi:hypothetical protein
MIDTYRILSVKRRFLLGRLFCYKKTDMPPVNEIKVYVSVIGDETLVFTKVIW